MKISLNVTKQGKQVGTCGWLKDILSNSSLHIGQTKNGLPGVYLISKSKDGKQTKEIIAFVAGIEYYDSYESWGENIYTIYAREINDHCHAFAGYLTDAAECIVDELISNCVDILKEYLNDDASDFEIEIVNKKA